MPAPRGIGLPDDLAARMRAAGADPDAVAWGPPVREGAWAVIELSDRHVVGAVERGRFAPYERFGTLAGAVECVTALLVRAPRVREAGAEEWAEVLRRGADRRVGSALGRGDVLGRCGADTGRYARPLHGGVTPEHVYEVLVDPGPDIEVDEVPDGDVEFGFPRPLRWYLDFGLLREVRPAG